MSGVDEDNQNYTSINLPLRPPKKVPHIATDRSSFETWDSKNPTVSNYQNDSNFKSSKGLKGLKAKNSFSSHLLNKLVN